MKNKAYLFCTRMRMYLAELPLIYLLYLAIKLNEKSTGLLKLYPLIITTAAAIIFIFVFLYRMIIITREDVRISGRFTSRDRAIINKGKILRLTLLPKKKLKVELFGKDERPSQLSWAQNDEQRLSAPLNLFRETARMGEGGIIKALDVFSVKEEDIEKILASDTYECEYDYFFINSQRTENALTVDIEFTKTV